MFGLFLRSWSQGLQAFVPIAVAWTWLRRRQPSLATSIRLGAIAAVPVSVFAAWAFSQSTRQAVDEAMLAGGALIAALVFQTQLRNAEGPQLDRSDAPRALKAGVALATILVVVRQTMELGAVLSTAVFGLHSLDATRAVLAGTSLAAVVAGGWVWIWNGAAEERLRRATQLFTTLFIIQVVLYGVHEAAEAHLVPMSEVVHEASEPYGPDGVYGVHFSELLVILPCTVAWLTVRGAARVAVLLVSAGAAAAGMLGPRGWAGEPWSVPVHAAAEDISLLTRRPHIVFRDTTQGSTFGAIGVSPLDAPDRSRASVDLVCERVAFGGGRGICLHAEKSFFGLFTGYTAVLLGSDFKPRGAPLALEGKPSRARVSRDGRWGAFTVFVLGDGYDTNFSTRTTLVDMTAGVPLGDLESFSTFRNGERFSAKDFNFWGVTFARDGNTFYASLRTSGTTYLVRGDIAARRLTVLRDNVECPSVSPDDRFVAFKKYIGPDPNAWRIAVVELATMKERLVTGETRYIDDQVEWLDADRLLYGITRRTTSIADVWVVSATGDASATVLLQQAESPTVVR